MMAWTRLLVGAILLAASPCLAVQQKMRVTLTRVEEPPSHITSVGDDLKLMCRVQWPKEPVTVLWKWLPASSEQTIYLHPVPELFAENAPKLVKYSVSKDTEMTDDQKFTLTIKDVEYNDDGIFSCHAFTNSNNDSDSLPLVVKGPPEVVPISHSRNTVMGYDAKVIIRFISRPPLVNVTWFAPNGTELDTNSTKYSFWKSVVNSRYYVKLTIANFTEGDAGQYRVVVYNERGRAEQTIEFSADPFVQMTTPNASTTFPLGSTAVFLCRAANFRQTPNFSWHHVGPSFAITRFDGTGSAGVSLNSSFMGMATATMRGVTYDMIGYLICEASEYGKRYNDTILVDVIGPPVIKSSTRTVRGAIGDEIELVCNVTSNPPPTQLKWMFDGAIVSLQEYDDRMLKTQTNIDMRHVVEVTSSEDYGIYMCQVANKYGTIGHSTNLVGPGSPTPEWSPCPMTPCVGELVCIEEEGTCVCPQGYYQTKDGKCIASSIRYSGDTGATDVSIWVGAGAGGVLVITVIMSVVLYTCWRRRHSMSKNNMGQGIGHLNAAYSHAQYASANIYEVITRPSDEFPRERLRFYHPLGIGKFGRVMKAEALSINRTGRWEEVAIKMCQESATDLDKEDLYNELAIIRKIPKHINVVSFYGACTYGEPLLLILEYVPFGDLRNYLRRKRPLHEKNSDSPMSEGESPLDLEIQAHEIDDGELTAKDLLSFALQSVKGMHHLETNNIVHRDVAARNVLIGYNGVCKVSDFGLARDVEGVDVYERTSKGPLPIRWMSPEALIEGSHSHKADVWAFGILLWEIVTLGASPYSTLTLRSVIDAVVAGKRLERPQHCQDELYSLMCRCWEQLPKDRPTFSSLCREVEFLLEKEADYIQLDQFQEAVYMVLEPDSTDEKL